MGELMSCNKSVYTRGVILWVWRDYTLYC